MIEIERKYLVNSNKFKGEAFKKCEIKQGYLNSHPNRTTRIRIQDKLAYITIKGISSQSGLSRYEWEKEIPYEEALELLKLCEPGVIEKIRYFVKYGNHIFEIDEFFGENAGLVMAEVELSSENEEFLKPKWLGVEVTGDKRYYNSQLCKSPFCSWKN